MPFICKLINRSSNLPAIDVRRITLMQLDFIELETKVKSCLSIASPQITWFDGEDHITLTNSIELQDAVETLVKLSCKSKTSPNDPIVFKLEIFGRQFSLAQDLATNHLPNYPGLSLPPLPVTANSVALPDIHFQECLTNRCANQQAPSIPTPALINEKVIDKTTIYLDDCNKSILEPLILTEKAPKTIPQQPEFTAASSEKVVLANKTTNNPKTNKGHVGIICDACEKIAFLGNRFKCLECPDFDLCEACFSKGYHNEHTMLVVRKPEPAGSRFAYLTQTLGAGLDNKISNMLLSSASAKTDLPENIDTCDSKSLSNVDLSMEKWEVVESDACPTYEQTVSAVTETLPVASTSDFDTYNTLTKNLEFEKLLKGSILSIDKPDAITDHLPSNNKTETNSQSQTTRAKHIKTLREMGFGAGMENGDVFLNLMLNEHNDNLANTIDFCLKFARCS